MKSLIKCIAFTLLTTNLFSQHELVVIDSIQLPCTNCYSRVIVPFKNDLIIGTSNAGVFSMNKKNKEIKQLIPAVKGIEFRDLAVHKNTIYAMGSGDNGIILSYSKETGIDTLLFEKGVFLDAIDVYKNDLLILGDPINQQFFLRKINLDNKTATNLQPLFSLPKEACYAASGKTAAVKDGKYYFISGGDSISRIHELDFNTNTTEWRTTELPLKSGEGEGPFSLYLDQFNQIHVVGGNYTQPTDSRSTGCYFNGTIWKNYTKNPSGYRSCVSGTNDILLSCGTTGIDLYATDTKEWKTIKTGNYCTILYDSTSNLWWISSSKNKLYSFGL